MSFEEKFPSLKDSTPPYVRAELEAYCLDRKKVKEAIESIKHQIHADKDDLETGRNIVPRLNNLITKLGLE